VKTVSGKVVRYSLA